MSHSLTHRCVNHLPIFVAAAVFMFIAGCATPIDRWQTSMQVYAAANNMAAFALDEGRISVEDAKTFRNMAKIARSALDGWLLTISPDGKTDDGAARSAATAAMAEIRAWLAKTLTKQ